MYKISYFGYDIYDLERDLGSGLLIETHSDVSIPKKDNTFKTINDALKYICYFLGTRYDKYDWCFEEDVRDEDDMWVLHIIVDECNKWANKTMIKKFQNDKLDLYDLLVNVKIEEC